MLELGVGDAVVLDPEVQRLRPAAEVGDERVVGVEHELRPRRASLDDGGPAVGDRVELAVAVELVAEQVGEQQRARLQLVDHRPEPELVDLEQPEVAVELAPAAARGGRQGGGDATRHVRAGAVVDETRAGALEDRRHHRGRRRLAVGGRDHDAAVLQPPGQQPDGVRLEAREQLARQRGAAAAAGAAGERADGLRRGQLGGEQAHGAMTLSAPGWTRTVAGRSAIGSPSACTLNGRSAWKATSRAWHISTPGLADVGAREDLRERRQVGALGHVADHHDVEQAVVELGVGGEVHAAAEHARVGDRDRVAGERARRAVDHDLPARGPPRPHGAQRRVDVDELAELQPRGVREVAGVGVEARAGDPEVGAAVDVGDVDALLAPRGEHVAGRRRVAAEPELAREVVAAPAGQHGEHAVGVAQLSRHRADQAVAAHRGGDLAVRERRAGELAGVLDRVRALHAEGDPVAAQRRLDRRQQPRAAAAARAGVDDQADGARHSASPSARSQSATPAGSDVTT